METRFRAIHGPIGTRSVKAVFDDGKLTLEGLDNNNRVVIKVEFDYVDAFSATEEGFRLDLFDEITTKDGFLFVDERSAYKSRLEKGSKHARDMAQAKHFIILLGEEVFDVISPSNPAVTPA